MSLLLAQLASGPLFGTLVVVALGAIVLGMGLPPGATYFIIVIAALSSGIDAVGVAPLTLHLFVVFFAVISTVYATSGTWPPLRRHRLRKPTR